MAESRRGTTLARWGVVAVVVLVAGACGTDVDRAEAEGPSVSQSTSGAIAPPASIDSASSSSSLPEFDDAAPGGRSCELPGLLPGVSAYVVASPTPGTAPVEATLEPVGTRIERRAFSVAEVRAGNGNLVGDLSGDQEFAVVTGYADGRSGRGLGEAGLDASSLGLLLIPLFYGEPGELQIAAVVSFDGFGEPVFEAGFCAARYQQQLEMVANYMGLDRELVLQGWITADLDSEGLNLYGWMLVEADQAARVQAGEEAWYAADPTQRSLDPGDVPAAVLATLDVLAVQLAIAGVTPDNVVLIRSESGASVAVAGPVLPILHPAFFAPTDRRIELLLGSSAADPAPRLLAAIELDTRTAQGFRLSGTTEAPVLDPLSDDDIASLAGLSSAADLAALRAQLLAR